MTIYVDFKNEIVCTEFNYEKVLAKSYAFQEFFRENWTDICGLDDSEIGDIDNFEDLDLDKVEKEEIVHTAYLNYLDRFCEKYGDLFYRIT